jgi:trehalose 6-phosphate synthase
MWTSSHGLTYLGLGAAALLVISIITLAATPLATSFMTQWSRADVETRSKLIFVLTRDDMTRMLTERQNTVQPLFERIAADEKVLAVGFCDNSGALRYATQLMPTSFTCAKVSRSETSSFSFVRMAGHQLLIGAFPLKAAGGHFVILNDLGFVEKRGAKVTRTFLATFIAIIFVALIASLVLAVITVRRWVGGVRRALVTARSGQPAQLLSGPFEHEVRQLLRQIDAKRSCIEEDRTQWDAGALRRLMSNELSGMDVIVVSNREPYIHNRGAQGIEIQLPASGLVAALEPVMRACGGAWIAHGSGSADADVVDGNDRIAVPPDDPSYTLRRIWLTDEEQDRYYYGFANEGLWPLCHIAFVRPIFRKTDWEAYRKINERFADAVVREAKTADPVVLVQDYHFALLPKMLRERLPGATIIAFWHIPWPNAETFGICPWKKEIVEGILGSSIVGFHTQFHCNNFLETVDRYVESRIDREHASVTVGDHEAFIKPYPISIAWPPTGLSEQKPAPECRAAVFARLGLAPNARLAVGIERFDYTKGIIDRMRAVDSLLTQHPEWRGRFVFYQAAAPTRSKLATYAAVQREAMEAADEINYRHGGDSYQPIRLVARHHEPSEVQELFRAADLCVVSSLHDGMNLVAKEFVAARDDEEGVLILSSFAGASRELAEAIIVNPYDAEGMGEAMHRGLSMPVVEQRERMHLMRELVRARNVYRWAGQMLLDAGRLRSKQRIVSLSARGASPDVFARLLRPSS